MSFQVTTGLVTPTEDEQAHGGLRWAPKADRYAVVMVPIEKLAPADSPRTGGEDEEHVLALTEVDIAMPPIIVHRPTMRVIDGMHRIRAAVLRGETHVAARFFDGQDRDCFVLAVSMNVNHGLPLSRADRAAAAARIIRSHPEHSDRAIAAFTGLSARTVAELRHGASAGGRQLNIRLGRDGRQRPLDAAVGRRRAGELINAHPDASLREIARTAGISVGTARDVRERMRTGQEPVLPSQRHARDGARVNLGPNPADRSPRSPMGILAELRRDPAVWQTEGGRAMLRLLSAHISGMNKWKNNLVDLVPAHCTGSVVELACACSDMWLDLASALAQRRDELTE